MVIANLAVRFIVELVGVGALAWSAYQAPLDGLERLALALAAALVLVGVWATVVAPKATNAIAQPNRDAIGTGLLVLVALVLAGAGQPFAAAVFGAVVVVNWLVGIALGQRPEDALKFVAGHRR